MMYHSIQFNHILSAPDTILYFIPGVRDIISTTLLITGHDILKIILTSHTVIPLALMG